MATNTSDGIKQLENQMENMSLYLEKLMQIDDIEEKDCGYTIDSPQGFAEVPNFNLQTELAPLTECLNTEPYPAPFASGPPTTSYDYGLVCSTSEYAKNMETSLLANAPDTSAYQFVSSATSYPRMRNRMEFPDSSSIDIDATMMELGLTPESLEQNQNKVHTLFSLFSDLEFTINAEFITTTIYDKETIPNTLSVSTQTRYAIWSSSKLLRKLRAVLWRPMPVEYKLAYKKCEEALWELQQAIVNLELFKNFQLEHRRGEFVTEDAEVCLQPLMAALKFLTEIVGKSRMYVQVYERALNAPERYKAALIASREDNQKPFPEENHTEMATSSSSSRPQVARRYIG